MNQRQDPDPNLIGAIVIATVSAVIVSLPACIAAFALGRALPTRRGLLFVSAVAGAGITALLYPSIAREMSAAFDGSKPPPSCSTPKPYCMQSGPTSVPGGCWRWGSPLRWRSSSKACGRGR